MKYVDTFCKKGHYVNIIAIGLSNFYSKDICPPIGQISDTQSYV